MARVDTHRVVLMGAGKVGKTSLVTRFIKGLYSEVYSPTIEDLHRYLFCQSDGKSSHMEILDTAGSHDFPAMRQLSIQSGHGFIVVYAYDDNKSMEDALALIHLIKEIKGRKDIPICLCRNKVDVCSVGTKYSSEKGICDRIPLESVTHLDVSVKDDYNVGAAFETIFKALTVPKIEECRKSQESLGARVIRRLSVALRDTKIDRRSSEGDNLKDMEDEEDNIDFRPRVASCGSILLKKKKKKEMDDNSSKNTLIGIDLQRRKSCSMVAKVDYSKISVPDSGVDVKQGNDGTTQDSAKPKARRHSAYIIVNSHGKRQDNSIKLSKSPDKESSPDRLRVRTCVEPVSPTVGGSLWKTVTTAEPDVKVGQFLKTDTLGRRHRRRDATTLEQQGEISITDKQERRSLQRSPKTSESDAEIIQFSNIQERPLQSLTKVKQDAETCQSIKSNSQERCSCPTSMATLKPDEELSQLPNNNTQHKHTRRRSVTASKADAIYQFLKSDAQDRPSRRTSITLEPDAELSQILSSDAQEKVFNNYPEFRVRRKSFTCIRTQMTPSSNNNGNDLSGSQIFLEKSKAREQIKSITVHQHIYVEKMKSQKENSKQHNNNQNLLNVPNAEPNPSQNGPDDSSNRRRRQNTVHQSRSMRTTIQTS